MLGVREEGTYGGWDEGCLGGMKDRGGRGREGMRDEGSEEGCRTGRFKGVRDVSDTVYTFHFLLLHVYNGPFVFQSIETT